MKGGWEEKGAPVAVAGVEEGMDLAGLNFPWETNVSFQPETPCKEGRTLPPVV